MRSGIVPDVDADASDKVNQDTFIKMLYDTLFALLILIFLKCKWEKYKQQEPDTFIKFNNG